MKLTKSQLKQIIKEELSKELDEGWKEETAELDAQTQQQMAKFEPLIKRITNIVIRKEKSFAGSISYPHKEVEAALEKSAEIIATSEKKEVLSSFAKYLERTLDMFKGDGTRHGPVTPRSKKYPYGPEPWEGLAEEILPLYNSIVAAIPAIAEVLPKPSTSWHPQGPHRGLIYLPKIPGAQPHSDRDERGMTRPLRPWTARRRGHGGS